MQADDASPSSSKKLATEDIYRIRIGNYRVIYEIRDGTLIVLVVKVEHRKYIYKKSLEPTGTPLLQFH